LEKHEFFFVSRDVVVHEHIFPFQKIEKELHEDTSRKLGNKEVLDDDADFVDVSAQSLLTKEEWPNTKGEYRIRSTHK